MGYSDFVVQVRSEGTLIKSIKKLSGDGRKVCYKCGRRMPIEGGHISFVGDGPANHPLAKFICQDCAPTKMDASDAMLSDLFTIKMKGSRPTSSRRRTIR